MAIIRAFEPGYQSVRLHRTEVDCCYQAVTGDDGSVYLHLTTFGSDDRAVPGKSSQSFQLNRSSAYALVKIVEATFGASRT